MEGAKEGIEKGERLEAVKADEVGFETVGAAGLGFEGFGFFKEVAHLE